MIGNLISQGILVIFSITSALLGYLEMTHHFLIDYLQCKAMFNLLIDKILHIFSPFILVCLYT